MQKNKQYAKRHGARFGMPKFPKIPTEVFQDLLTCWRRLWSFWNILIMKLDQEFLNKPLEDWQNEMDTKELSSL